MIRVSPVEFARNVERYSALARTDTVVVGDDSGDAAVLISADEYRRLKRLDRQVLGLEDFTDDDLAAIERATAPDTANAFDREMAT